ncbi:hypothetical protein M0R45_002399 [Rubus argutus]|uniref:Uncharacterized protein n=1 Tax=Rubus argutus TaxID=59490 RepID=A0AAW1VTH8_RUBAR
MVVNGKDRRGLGIGERCWNWQIWVHGLGAVLVEKLTVELQVTGLWFCWFESSRWLSWDGDDFCVNQAYMKAWK